VDDAVLKAAPKPVARAADTRPATVVPLPVRRATRRSQRRRRSVAPTIDTIVGTTTTLPASSAQTELAGRDMASTGSP
jgi:hypothetical protein